MSTEVVEVVVVVVLVVPVFRPMVYRLVDRYKVVQRVCLVISNRVALSPCRPFVCTPW